MTNLLIVAKEVLILFLLMGVGFACRKRNILNEASSKGVVDVLILFVTPCVIVDAFLRPFDPTMLKGLSIAFSVAVLTHIVVIALARLLVRHRSTDTQCVLRVAAVFSNAGFMGIPLEQAILGPRGVFYGVSYIIVFNIFIWSWGYSTMRRSAAGERLPYRIMLVNPGTIGLSVGLLAFFSPFVAPDVVREPIHALAAMNTPLAMIVIGYYLAGARLKAVALMPSVHFAALIRLVIAPILVLSALYPFRHALDRDMMLALVIASGAPVAAMVSMFAAKFDRNVDVSVGLVSGTTLLSILTMPPVVALAMFIL